MGCRTKRMATPLIYCRIPEPSRPDSLWYLRPLARALDMRSTNPTIRISSRESDLHGIPVVTARWLSELDSASSTIACSEMNLEMREPTHLSRPRIPRFQLKPSITLLAQEHSLRKFLLRYRLRPSLMGV